MALSAPTLVPNGATLVVVAPHPDDDVLGCGALLAATARRSSILVVYVTDGAASHLDSPTFPPARLRAVREAEARRGLRRLGIRSEPLFLRWPDGTVPQASADAAAPLLDRLRAALPSDEIVVAAPWRRDPHADHRAVASLVDAALHGRPHTRRIEYAVWLGVLGDAGDEPRAGEGIVAEFDARPWLHRKRAAINAHRSQFGRLIRDAAWSFELPPALLAAALGPRERFIVSSPASV